jgi:hypothetical protein
MSGWKLLKVILSLIYWGAAAMFAWFEAHAGVYSVSMLWIVVALAVVVYAVFAALWRGLALFFRP